MTTLRFYGYKKCSTCRQAEKALLGMGRAYDFIDITENPPQKEGLRTLVRQSGADLKRFFNTSGVQYRELGIKDRLPDLSEGQILDLLSENGRLLKRPLVTDGKKTTVGFDPAAFQSAWNPA